MGSVINDMIGFGNSLLEFGSAVWDMLFLTIEIGSASIALYQVLFGVGIVGVLSIYIVKNLLP